MSDVIINQYLGDLSGVETISEIISGSSVNMRSGQDQIAGDKQSAMMDDTAVTLPSSYATCLSPIWRVP